jgi:mannose-6-phosphate isomerase-like protein (cupin superfamily)
LGLTAFDDALTSVPSAYHLTAAELDARFAVGGVFGAGDDYAVDAGRRSTPGEVEWHASVTDVMHVVHGSATVVTGGELVDARVSGPGEQRAHSVVGGTEHRLEAGDVLVVPAGVPHQFTAVSDPFHYFVTKVGRS